METLYKVIAIAAIVIIACSTVIYSQTCEPEEACTLTNDNTAARTCIKGTFDNGAGCICSYTEIAGSGPGPRTFTSNCVRSGKPNLNCRYSGNPHCCRSYNQGNQAEFYRQLSAAIGPTQCRDPFNHCPDTTRGYFTTMCGDTHGSNSNSNFYNML